MFGEINSISSNKLYIASQHSCCGSHKRNKNLQLYFFFFFAPDPLESFARYSWYFLFFARPFLSSGDRANRNFGTIISKGCRSGCLRLRSASLYCLISFGILAMLCSIIFCLASLFRSCLFVLNLLVFGSIKYDMGPTMVSCGADHRGPLGFR